jgi:ParB-like chromosome segregation protein Spo0J
MRKPFKSPVYNVIPVPLEKMVANDYNPNKVAKTEMDLLYHSILCDGYTQPVVAYYDGEADRFVIVDGFHRYRIMKERPDIYERENGLLPVVVIEKDINDRMASTIRHNRARGKHGVELQSALVAALKENWNEAKIQKELGMTSEEVKRLCGIVGISSEIAGVDYNQAQQVKIMLENEDETPDY